eukprot:CAMPEP_0202963108 /NCGR_PEP_ID=MMETSP1396-20130829/7105_1 /ASSEMBLY_ACC=CAM_ASM_000872 /TAXON_ID= /ORGANISM="Pseudokeronopsis sp., Strain Brazil" /LENGTH=44 /DNA_ID= /DNA_START= /DNA_END= /DNA_ORIENTATION=
MSTVSNSDQPVVFRRKKTKGFPMRKKVFLSSQIDSSSETGAQDI